MGVLVVVAVSMLEAFPGLSWKKQCGFAMVLSCGFSYQALTYTLSYAADNEYELELWPGASFGLVSYIAAAYRVLSLFMWKQTLMAIYTQGEFCIAIYLIPSIQWDKKER